MLAIHDVVDSDGLLFLVMDYHPGGDLADRLARQAPLDAGEAAPAGRRSSAARWRRRTARASSTATSSRRTCCAAPGRELDVRLCDFGLARTADLAGLTTANAVLGTPEYMAPEVITDGHADPRSDIYSLGVMLFEAATGRLPFYGDSPYQLMRQHVDVEAPRARSLAPELPRGDRRGDRPRAGEGSARSLRDRRGSGARAGGGRAAPRRDGGRAGGRGRRRAPTCPRCGGWLVEAAAAAPTAAQAQLRLEHRARAASPCW